LLSFCHRKNKSSARSKNTTAKGGPRLQLSDVRPPLTEGTPIPQTIDGDGQGASAACLSHALRNFHAVEKEKNLHPTIRKAMSKKCINDVAQELMRLQNEDANEFLLVKVKHCSTIQEASDWMLGHGQERAILCLRLAGVTTRSGSGEKHNHFAVLRSSGTDVFLLDSYGNVGSVKQVNENLDTRNYDFSIRGLVSVWILEYSPTRPAEEPSTMSANTIVYSV